jgi:hypothetical protein
VYRARHYVDYVRVAVLSCSLAMALGCASAAVAPAPPAPASRPPGCDVVVFRGPSPVAITALGAVEATCDEALSEEACLRRLQDDVCRLGGDVAYEVLDASRLDRNALRWSARAGRRRASSE